MADESSQEPTSGLIHHAPESKKPSYFLPNELWANIFKYLRPCMDLYHLSFVSHVFRDFIQPLLFRELTFLINVSAEGDQRMQMFDLVKERLDFILSRPSLIHAVFSITIIGYQTNVQSWSESWGESEGRDGKTLSLIVTYLSRLPNLCRFVAGSLYLTVEHVRTIQGLIKLRRIEILKCTVDLPPTILSPRCSLVSLKHVRKSTEQYSGHSSSTLDWLCSLCGGPGRSDASQLTELCLRTINDIKDFEFITTKFPRGFPNLLVLEIGSNSIFPFPTFISLLRSTPRLRDLRITRDNTQVRIYGPSTRGTLEAWSSQYPDIPNNVIPNLKVFRGDLPIVLKLLPRRTITTLIAETCFTDQSFFGPRPVTEVMSYLKGYFNQVEHLSLVLEGTLEHCRSAIESLADTFDSLKSLQLNFYRQTNEVRVDLKNLIMTTTFPISLEHLFMVTENYRPFEYYDEELCWDGHHFEDAIVRVLNNKCPRLQRFVLDIDDDPPTQWCRSSIF
ncbi:hypothetical protein C8Q75DRAFT_811585 [Abortiporus biennis]|nr:hypothetical protein C8Q75DRAFT_811585 [Abortiporus biennis]